MPPSGSTACCALRGRADKIAELLGVPADKTVRILLPLGVAAEPGRQREKLPFGQRAWFNRYGGSES